MEPEEPLRFGDRPFAQTLGFWVFALADVAPIPQQVGMAETSSEFLEWLPAVDDQQPVVVVGHQNGQPLGATSSVQPEDRGGRTGSRPEPGHLGPVRVAGLVLTTGAAWTTLAISSTGSAMTSEERSQSFWIVPTETSSPNRSASTRAIPGVSGGTCRTASRPWP